MVTTPYVSDVLSELMSSISNFWDQNEIIELIHLREYERYKDFKDELG